jgi:hypothetical protein
MKTKLLCIIFFAMCVVHANAQFSHKPTIDVDTLVNGHAGIIPGIPVDLKLPWGEQIYITPLGSYSIGDMKGYKTPLYLSKDAGFFSRVALARSEDSVVVLWGIKIDPLSSWTEKQRKSAKAVLTEKGFTELESFLWLRISNFEIYPPGTVFIANSVSVPTGNLNLKGQSVPATVDSSKGLPNRGTLNPQIQSTGDSSIVVSWNSYPGAVKYTVDIYYPSNNYTLPSTKQIVGSTTCPFRSLDQGASYKLIVHAINANNEELKKENVDFVFKKK